MKKTKKKKRKTRKRKTRKRKRKKKKKDHEAAGSLEGQHLVPPAQRVFVRVEHILHQTADIFNLFFLTMKSITHSVYTGI
jgi:hypothetical protein